MMLKETDCLFILFYLVHVTLETTMKGILHNINISSHGNLLEVPEQNALNRVYIGLYSSLYPLLLIMVLKYDET